MKSRYHKLDDWLTWMQDLHHVEIDLGIERIRQVAERMDLLKPAATVVTVAGTNGKGSCIASLDALLRHPSRIKPFRVGVYTSPHILNYCERIRVDGDMVSEMVICEAFDQIDRARGDISLTYFEFSALAALFIFVCSDLDVYLLEVGLGGRLDAINIIDSEISIITSIDLDHQEWLGNTREQIAIEKAGVLRQGATFVCAEPEPPKSLLAIARELQVQNYQISEAFDYHYDGRELMVMTSEKTYTCLPRPNLPLPSVAAAIQTAVLIAEPLDESAVMDTLSTLQLPGRFCQLAAATRPCGLLVDVAHNPAATKMLAKRILEEAVACDVAVVGMMKDKALTETLAPMLDHIKFWVVTEFDENPRSASVQMLVASLLSLGVQDDCIFCERYPGKALDTAFLTWQLLRAPKQKRPCVLAFGSFLTVESGYRYALKHELSGDI